MRQGAEGRGHGHGKAAQANAEDFVRSHPQPTMRPIQCCILMPTRVLKHSRCLVTVNGDWLAHMRVSVEMAVTAAMAGVSQQGAYPGAGPSRWGMGWCVAWSCELAMRRARMCACARGKAAPNAWDAGQLAAGYRCLPGPQRGSEGCNPGVADVVFAQAPAPRRSPSSSVSSRCRRVSRRGRGDCGSVRVMCHQAYQA